MNDTLRVPPMIAGWIAAGRRILAGPDGFVALALVLGLVGMIEALLYTRGGGSDRTTAMVLAMLSTLPLALVRTRRAWLAGVLITGSTLINLADAGPFTLSGLVAQLIVLYLVAARSERIVSVLLAAPFAINAIAPFSGHGDSWAVALLVLVLVVATQILGDAQRQRGQAIAERDETKRAMADTQREQAATQERARIARELHDVVAHHLSMIAVQAETARLATAGMPEEGKQRLLAIGNTARDSLTEMRRLLGVLRPDVDGGVALAPQPGLGQLSDLVESARGAGSPVTLTLTGPATPLSPGVDLTAYRILQEALTNARRHAPGAAVEVELHYDPDTLHVRVRDSGPGPSDSPGPNTADPYPTGHGLHGMRERATMVGGTLHAGPADGGGFQVVADLPIEGPR